MWAVQFGSQPQPYTSATGTDVQADSNMAQNVVRNKAETPVSFTPVRFVQPLHFRTYLADQGLFEELYSSCISYAPTTALRYFIP